jgi:hypothetical protein
MIWATETWNLQLVRSISLAPRIMGRSTLQELTLFVVEIGRCNRHFRESVACALRLFNSRRHFVSPR